MKFLLAAINAKYIHSNLGVYSLKRYGEKQVKSVSVEIGEYTINHMPEAVLKDIYMRKPDAVGFSCYIWNISYVCGLISDLKKVLPRVHIWLGGPEVSYCSEEMLKKYGCITGIMIGEGEKTFAALLKAYEERQKELERMPEEGELKTHLTQVAGLAFSREKEDGGICVTPPRQAADLDDFPFSYESLDGFTNRIIYYESSRGCPFSCSYCLSSIDKSVRFRSMELVKKELDFFLEHKVAQVKFVDRTFNCKKSHAMAIWKHIADHDNGITNFHFEISADLLDEEELELLGTLRPGLIQLEIGVQTVNPHTIREIRRKTDLERLKKVVARIRKGRNIHQHLDLIAGLPFEDYKSFQESFCQVYEMEPDELQLGFLKVLKGSYMAEMVSSYELQYREKPPYEVLSTKWISYEEIIRLKGVEEMVEVYYNSRQFIYTLKMLEQEFPSPFAMFECLADYYEKEGLFEAKHSRVARYEILYRFICERLSLPEDKLGKYRDLLVYDLYLRENAKSRPSFALEQQQYKQELKPCYDEYFRAHRQKDKRMVHIEVFEDGRQILFDYEKRDVMTYNGTACVINLDKDGGKMGRKETKAERKERVKKVLELLDQEYGTEYRCYLNHETPWQLLIAVIMSAQCTDARVNIVTAELFKKYDTLEKFAQADLGELENDIRSIGFYHMKAKNIIACCKALVENHGGVVPRTMEELTALAGVGRKTANVIRGNIYNEPSIVVDTHVKRISRKLGFVKAEEPEKIEYELMEVLPKDHWILWNIHIITLGRTICTARNPKCGECFLKEFCPSCEEAAIFSKNKTAEKSRGKKSGRKADGGSIRSN